MLTVRALGMMLALLPRVSSLTWMSSIRPSMTTVNVYISELSDDPTTNDVGPLRTAAACSARCYSDPGCSAYTWFGSEQTDRRLQPIARHCVLSRGSGATVRPCDDVGCNQFAGARIASPWPTNGYDKLPALWFGANETGLDSADTLALVGKHALSGYGWQQGIQTHGNRHSEIAQAEAATHARDYLDSVGNINTTLFVYRQIQKALGLFDVPRAAADNQNNAQYWLHDENDPSVICGTKATGQKPAGWGTYDPYPNFTHPATRDWWMDDVIEELCDEHAGYTAVYFDELDPSWCGWWGTDSSKGNCSGFSNETQQDQAHAYYSMAANMTQRLNDCGIVPIFAAFGVLEASGGHGINPHNPCVLWEDELVAALDGLQWARFYEQWPDQFHMRAANHSEADRFAQVLTNGILEGQAGIAVVAHTTQGLTNCSNTSAAESDEAPFVPSGTAAFHLASFLIAQGPNWVYGVSSAWTDNAFCWHRSYDVQCGHPLGVANRIGPYTFTRNFTGCDVSVETVGLIGEIRLK